MSLDGPTLRALATFDIEIKGYGAVTLKALVHYLCSHDQQHLAGLQWLPGRIEAAGPAAAPPARSAPRRPPRGVPRTRSQWSRFARTYRAEMAAPDKARTIALLAALSRGGNFSVGCYCEDESRCHRSVLRELLVAAGASIASASR